MKPPRKPSKYKAIATEFDGILFPSKKEANRWAELLILERAGEIRNLRRQIAIKLIGQHAPILTRTGRAMKLTIDFAYEDKRLGWVEVFEEAKGKRTRDFDVRIGVAEAMGIKVILT